MAAAKRIRIEGNWHDKLKIAKTENALVEMEK